MRVLVTGASAYAGFHAAAALSATGHHVRGLTRDATSARAVQLLQREVQPVQGDLREPDSYRRYLEDSDVLVHAMMDPDDPRGTDETLFRTMTEVAAADTSLHKRLFVYTTGCSIYGRLPERVMDETTPATPGHALAFRMELEKAALALPGFRTVVLRPGFMYGLDGLSSISARWFQMGEEGAPVYRGDPEKGWSWVHMSNLADAYVRAVESGPLVAGEVFCVADEQRPRCLEVMRACLRVAGHEGEIELGPPREDDPRFGGHARAARGGRCFPSKVGDEAVPGYGKGCGSGFRSRPALTEPEATRLAFREPAQGCAVRKAVQAGLSAKVKRLPNVSQGSTYLTLRTRFGMYVLS